MSNSPQQITLGQVLEMSPGINGNRAFINDEFDAIVNIVEKKTSREGGKDFWIAQLVDPHNDRIAIETTFFRPPDQYNGKVCHFHGSGMTREEYKGRAKVGLGRDTKIQIMGKAPGSTPPPSDGNRAPAGENGRPPTQTPPAALNAPFAARAVVEALAVMKSLGTIEFFEPSFAGQLHTLASDILRVHNWLEAGKLAPKAGATPEPQAKEDAPRGGPNRAPIDSDVPF